MPETAVTIINETAALEAFCARAAEFPYITIDTEFIRERTYYPKLCLVQIAAGDEGVLIDPLAKGFKLDAMIDLLNNERVLKVFHAARQDLEIFFHMTGKVPHPVFDTQVAAMVCGYGESISYDNLVRELSGTDLDKSSRFTNWEQRPLTQKQLVYALGDVTHLQVVYEKLRAKLEANGRISWIEEEMSELIAPETHKPNPDDAWMRLKVRTRSHKFLAVLKAVAAWRERAAQKMDLPRTRVLKDETVTDIAASGPKSLEELYQLRGMNRGFDKTLMEDLLEKVNHAKNLPRNECPELPPSLYLPPEAGAAIELLRVLLKRQCDKLGVAQKLIATRDELEHVAVGKLKQTHLAHGWRWEVFGKHAADLMAGELGLALNPDTGSVILLSHEDLAQQS